MTQLTNLFRLAVEALLSEASLKEFVLFGTVLLLATTAAYVARRSGVFDLALDGTIVTSTLFAYLASELMANAVGHAGVASMMAGFVSGILGGLAFTVLVEVLNVKTGGNDILVGILANFGARNLSIFLVGLSAATIRLAQRTLLPALHLQLLTDVPVLGRLIGDANLMTWVALLLPLVAFWIMNRTQLGLCLRAAEENPSALIGAGVSLRSVRLKGMLLSGTIASLAGAACAMGAVPERATATLPQGFGYLALVIVFAAGGRLGKSFGFALLFSFLGALPTVFGQLPLPQTLVSSLVYLAALVLMMLHVLRHHRRVRKNVKTQKRQHEEHKSELLTSVKFNGIKKKGKDKA